MKRQKKVRVKSPFHVVLPIFTWCECQVCRNEFRFEKMLAYWSGGLLMPDFERYVCRQCAEDPCNQTKLKQLIDETEVVFPKGFKVREGTLISEI